MAQGILDRLDHNCNRKELANLYKKWAGIDSIEFDRLADKPLAAFHQEINRQDAIVFWHAKAQSIVRFALGVRCLYDTPEGLILEIGRQHGDHEPKMETKPWTISGQHRRNERPLRAVQREAWGELRERIDEEKLIPLSPIHAPEPTLRRSSVYPHTLSAVMVQRFLYKRDANLATRTIVDGDTKVFLEVFPEIPPGVMEKYLESIEHHKRVFGSGGFTN